MTAGSPAGGRLASGNQQLDAILGGGFPAHAINLVVGPPGSGKTILAQQYVFHNASPERPAVYLTTVSEPLEKVLRYGQTMAFFDPAAVGRAVFYEDVGELLGTQGLSGVLERIDAQHRGDLGHGHVQVAASDPPVGVAGGMTAGWCDHIAAPAPPVHMLQSHGMGVAEAGRGQVDAPLGCQLTTAAVMSR
jgi:hypothetical protein